MWTIIAITILALISAILIIKSAMKDADRSITSETERMYNEIYDAEHSPENTISDKTIKIAHLRNKLNKIEKERLNKTKIISFGDFDHSRIDGK